MRQEMMQDERRDHTDLPACDEKSVVAMNTPDQNANAGEELAFAMMLNKRQEQDTLLHDERVIAVRDEFMDVSVVDVSDKNGCLSRSHAFGKMHAACPADQHLNPQPGA